MAKNVYESSVRESGDMGGVYEFDGDVAYFYLYDCEAPDGERVVGAMQVRAGKEGQPRKRDLAIEWDDDQRYVGLIVFGQLVAVYDVETRKGYWGRGGASTEAVAIPERIERFFDEYVKR